MHCNRGEISYNRQVDPYKTTFTNCYVQVYYKLEKINNQLDLVIFRRHCIVVDVEPLLYCSLTSIELLLVEPLLLL